MVYRKILKNKDIKNNLNEKKGILKDLRNRGNLKLKINIINYYKCGFEIFKLGNYWWENRGRILEIINNFVLIF